MKQSIVLTAALLLLSLIGCKDKEANDATFKLTFRVYYDGQPALKGTQYSYDGGLIDFSYFGAYFSDITLERSKSDVQVAEIERVEFTPTFAPNDSFQTVTLTYSVPSDTYTGIRFGMGVKPDLNKKKPADFKTGHPLANETEHWPGWKSYIFNRIEGTIFLNPASQLPGSPLVWHPGSDPVYRTIQLSKDIDIQSTGSATIELDLKKVFFANNTWLDLSQEDNRITSNDVGDIRVATILMDNFGGAFLVK